MNKTGLVIQGPLVSRGVTGLTYKNWGQESPDDIIEYDCIPNIIQIFNDQRFHFHHIVVVIWDTECKNKIDFIAKNIGNENILIINDNTKFVPESIGLTPKNNHFRQFLAVLLGSKHLVGMGCNWIAKIRSDQYFNANKLADLHKKFDQKSYSKIVVPYFRIDHPYFIMDFYFFGSADSVIKFCQSLLNFRFTLGSVHQDLFYSWADNFRGNHRFFTSKIISLFSGTRVERSFSKYIWDNCFIPGPREVYQSLIWRGEKFPPPIDKNLLFLEDTNLYFMVNRKYFNSNPYLFMRVPLRIANKLFKYLTNFFW